jgi:hypothetical protein
MLTPEQINNIHRLHWVEKWSVRKIARQLNLGRRTIAKYLTAPAPPPVHRDRGSKLDSFKPTIAELLEQDSTISAALIEQRLRAQGFDGPALPRDLLGAGDQEKFCGSKETVNPTLKGWTLGETRQRLPTQKANCWGRMESPAIG